MVLAAGSPATDPYATSFRDLLMDICVVFAYPHYTHSITKFSPVLVDLAVLLNGGIESLIGHGLRIDGIFFRMAPNPNKLEFANYKPQMTNKFQITI